MILTASTAFAENETTTTEYFTDTVKITKFGGSITTCADSATKHWTHQVSKHIADTYGNGSYELTNYAVGGEPSITGLSNALQAFKATAETRKDAPDIVIIEYAVNDSSYAISQSRTDFTEGEKQETTVVKYDSEKDDLNIWDADKGAYVFDYVNTAQGDKPASEVATGRASGHYELKVNEEELKKSTLRIEEIVRLAQNLDSKPAIFLVNTGIGMTLGSDHADYPGFPGVANSIARYYDEVADRLSIAHVNLEKEIWKYTEEKIAEKLGTADNTETASETGETEETTKTRQELIEEINKDLFGGSASPVHPTFNDDSHAGSDLYANKINEAIDATPESFLKPVTIEDTKYTETVSYSDDTHIIPYTMGEYSEGDWSLARAGSSGNSTPAFSYDMSTSKEGATATFTTKGALIGIITNGYRNCGNFGYEIVEKDTNNVVYESSTNCNSMQLFDQYTTWKVNNETTKLDKDKEYTVTVTKGNDGETLHLYGVAVNTPVPVGGYTSYTTFNAEHYIAYNDQTFDFEPIDTAVDNTIGTYFSDTSDISYTEGAAIAYDTAEDAKNALAFTANTTNDKITINLNEGISSRVVNISFDLKWTSADTSQLYVKLNNNSIFRVVTKGNNASPCINTGSNRFSNTVNDWWANKASDGKYHNIRLRLTPAANNQSTVELWIDGVKGDTPYTGSFGNYDTLEFTVAGNNTTYTATTYYLDNIKISDEVTEVTSLINSIGTVTLDSEDKISEARERADHINTAYGSYASISNYATLENAETALSAIKDMKDKINLKESSVFNPFVGNSVVYDYDKDYTVSKVTVDGTGIDVKTKDGRLLIGKDNINEAKDYTIAVTFKDSSENELTVAKTLTVLENKEVTIKASDLTADDYTHSETISNNGSSSDNFWNLISSGWSGWAELGSEPWYQRLDTTKTIEADTYWFTFKNLPKALYKVEYAKYGEIAEARIPLIDVKSGTTTLSSQDPYSSAKSGYLDFGTFNFVNDNTLTVSASKTQRTNNDSTAIMCVYGIKLTPVVTDEAEILSYYNNGTTVIDSINNATTAEALKAIVTENAEYIGVNANALEKTDSIYVALAEKSDYATVSDFKTAFETAVKNALTSETVALTRSLEDLRLHASKGFFIRSMTEYAIDQGSNSRPAYLTYNVDTTKLADLDFSFTYPSDKTYNAVIDITVVNEEIPNVTAVALKDSETDETKKANYTALDDFTKKFDASAEATSSVVMTKTVTVSPNGTATVNLKDLIEDLKTANGVITLKLSTTTSSVSVNNVTLTAYYDKTNVKPLEKHEYYTIDKVSFVNCTTGDNADKGFIGSVVVTKNEKTAPDVKAYVAVYSDNGTKLVDVFECSTLKDGKFSISGFTVKEPSLIKVFLWGNNTDDTMTPYAQAFTITNPTNHDGTDGKGSLWYKPDGSTETPDN